MLQFIKGNKVATIPSGADREWKIVLKEDNKPTINKTATSSKEAKRIARQFVYGDPEHGQSIEWKTVWIKG